MNDILDRSETRTQFDPSGILDAAERFLDQCRHAEKLAREFALPPLKKFDKIVICGMGGSAIGGDLIRAYAYSQSPVPIEVIRNYTLPAYVNKNSLVIAGSYSGNTEETLSCYRDARKREAQIVAIATGGELARLCQGDGVPSLTIPTGYAPRAALGYSVLPLLVFLERWGLLPDQTGALSDLYTTLKNCIAQYEYCVPQETNPAKQLAASLHGFIPVVYAGQDVFEPVAARWRAQLNENTKSFAHNFVVPEMNHNEILGWSHPDAVRYLKPVFLLDSGYHKQITRRFAVMKSILETANAAVLEIHSQGEGAFARMMSLVCLGDFTSIYLAYLYNQDPAPIPAIDRLKSELAK